MKCIYKHTSQVVLAMNHLKKKGGRQMKQYLEKKWNMQLQPKFIKNQQKVITCNVMQIPGFTWFCVHYEYNVAWNMHATWT